MGLQHAFRWKRKEAETLKCMSSAVGDKTGSDSIFVQWKPNTEQTDKTAWQEQQMLLDWYRLFNTWIILHAYTHADTQIHIQVHTQIHKNIHLHPHRVKGLDYQDSKAINRAKFCCQIIMIYMCTVCIYKGQNEVIFHSDITDDFDLSS